MLEARATGSRTRQDGRPPIPGGVAIPLACGACLAAGLAYVAAVDPSDGGGLASCPIRAATGLWCPGCGLTRAAHHLARGDVPAALSLNLLTPAVLIGLAVLWSSWVLVAAGRPPPNPIAAIGPRGWVSAAVLVAAFTVVRNVPGWEGLRGG